MRRVKIPKANPSKVWRIGGGEGAVWLKGYCFFFWSKNYMRGDGDVFQGLFPKFATAVFSWCRFLTDDLVLAFWTSKLNVADFYDPVRWKTRQSRGLYIFTRSDNCKPTIKLD